MSPKKIGLYATALSVGVSAFALSAAAKNKSRSFEKSAYSSYQSLPVNTAAAEKTTRIASKQFPGWVVTTDKLSGLFADVYGAPVQLTGNTTSDKAQNAFAQKLKNFGMDPANWQQVSNPVTAKTDYVNFREIINQHPVVYSWLSFRFTKAGELSGIQMSNYGNTSGNMAPAISAADARSIATQDLTDITVTAATMSTDWLWYPVPAAGGYTLHPSWRFEIEGRAEGSVPLDLTGYIDAIDGTILERTNETRETSYDLTVNGIVYKDGTLLPPTSQPLPDLGLQIGPDTFYTDAAGKYSSSLLSLPLSTTIPLVGKWSTVVDSITGSIPVFTSLVTIPGTSYTYPTLAPSSDRHVNAYYHVNRVHNFMKGYFPTFTGMDYSLPTNVDLTSGTCNAFYNKNTINFYQASSGCNSFSEIGDIIYHEYGHGITDHFYRFITGGTSMRNGSLNEACSDIWALSITKNPVLGANSFVGYGGFIRRYDMIPQVYPIDLETNLSLADVHKNGQIIAGAWWDVAVNLGSADTMTQLFTDVYYKVPDGPNGKEGAIYQSILTYALMADDDNANLLDGTPHYNQIVAAFAKHGIYIEGDVKLTHSELTNQPENTPIPVTATLTMTTASYFHDLTLYYRVNGAGPWNPIVLTNSSLKFTGTIPAQPMGTAIEYYFVVHDQLGTPNAFFPVTCNPALPAGYMTIPYQFAVGIKSAQSINFESTAAGWKISGNPADDATGGVWRQAVPAKNTNFDSWPAGDHTSGTGKCLITGSGSSGFLGTGVTGGTSTVLSPLFSISGYANPVVEYYRWFSNEAGYSNFKNDPWIVKVRSSGTAAWQEVENTYQGDANWRRRIFQVKSYFPGGAGQLQFMFIASDSIIANWDNNGQSTTVGGVDDIFIYDQGTTLATPALQPVRAEIYPNPANDNIRIVLQGGNSGAIALYDMLGKEVKRITVDQNTTAYTLLTKDLSAGTYNLLIQTDKTIQSKKIVVVHD